MEITRAKGEIDDISDSRNKNRRTFFKKPACLCISVSVELIAVKWSLLGVALFDACLRRSF